MPDDPTPALLYRLNQNIMALGCAIKKSAPGSISVALRIRINESVSILKCWQTMQTPLLS